MSDGELDPREFSRTRLQERKAARERLDKRFDRIGNVRLALVVITIALVLLPLVLRQAWPWWSLIAVGLAHLALGSFHDRIGHAVRGARSAEAFYEAALARLDDRWRDLEADGSDLVLPGPGAAVAADLDVFGPASLFQLLNRAVSRHGQKTLARWLASPAEPQAAVERQEAVTELARDVDFREALAVAAGAGEESLADHVLLEWAEQPEPLPMGSVLRALGVALPALLVIATAIFAFGGPGEPLAFAVIAQLGLIVGLRRHVETRAAMISTPERTLLRYAAMIETLENGSFKAPVLVAARDRVVGGRDQIAQLQKLVDRLDARLNVFFALTVGPILLWDLNHVLQAERWQKKVGPHLREWLRALGEVEAMASLGAFAFERPDYCMPQFAEASGVYDAKGLAHPLIRRGDVVANDLELGGSGAVILLSGSNMSGKSTFLRAIGLSVVLARAGAPVPATALTLSPFVLATSLRVSDSLARGASHFYAELERIRAALDDGKTHGARLLYLLDEMLHGTNSRERYIGGVAIIRWLSAQGAVGIVTTHDLSLVQVESELTEDRLRNFHFGDDVETDKITFDYTLKPGPVRSTNALRLMRAMGIDIDLDLANAPPPVAAS